MRTQLRWSLAALAVASYAAPTLSTSLVDAIKNQDKDAARTLLKQHPDVNAAEPDGTTALQWAAHWNDPEMADLLLRAGAEVRSVNRYGVSPLSEAAAAGSGALVERLLKAGADPNTLATKQGETVLMTASRVGNIEAVKVLLDHGADADARENYRGQTALMWAAAEGHPDVLKLLIAHGADLNVRSFDRDTTAPKMEAGTPASPIARGGLTALQFAARQGEMESARTLLDAGADINQKDSDGNTALALAILNTHYDLAQFLMDRSADVNIANKDGRTALFTAVDVHDADWSPRPARKETDQRTSMDIIHALLAHGANVNGQLTAASPIMKLAQDPGDRSLGSGATPFMRAARSADLELMRLLLDKGANPKLANKDGLNALMLAAGVSWADKIRGTDAEALEAVKFCLAQGLDVNAATDKGDTALHGAAGRGVNAIVKYLVENGAKMDVKNKQGFTPLDIAMGKVSGVGVAPKPPKESTVALLQQLNQ
jgi:ankyrin repeat protein